MRWSAANCDLAAGSYAIYVPFIVYFFLLLVFFPCHPSARPLIHLQRPFSAVWRSPFAAGKVLVLTMSISLAFPLPRLSCCFGREVVTY